jgi:hypothetical protein
MDGPLELSSDGQLLRDYVALHFCAFVYQNDQRPKLALDMAEYLYSALAGNFTDDCRCVPLRATTKLPDGGSVMAWCPIGFPIALDGGALYPEIILGRRAPKWDVRHHIGGIVLTF